MNKPSKAILLCAGISLVLASCGGEPEKKEIPTPEEETAVLESATDQIGFGDQGNTTYAVPSPNELFSIIKDSKLDYKEGLIGTEAPNYSSSKDQALNFGRLTADIAYTASYEKFQESMANFDNLRKIGDDLGIGYVFDELMVNRVKNNMDNVDSLEVISNSSYQRIIQMLEENEKGSTLAIIAAGGFIESIYILTNLVGEYEEGSEVAQRLADEKFVLENIVSYLTQYEDEARVQEVLTELQPLSNVYLNLQEVEGGESKTVENDKVILGGTKVTMNEEEFNKIKEMATAYRNSFANPSQS